jgi:hypothetical protein
LVASNISPSAVKTAWTVLNSGVILSVLVAGKTAFKPK